MKVTPKGNSNIQDVDFINLANVLTRGKEPKKHSITGFDLLKNSSAREGIGYFVRLEWLLHFINYLQDFGPGNLK